MSRNHDWRRMLPICALALAIGCTTGMAAQDPGDRSAKVIFTIDEGVVEIHIHGDDVQVKLDGDEMPDDMYERQGNVLRFKDDQGFSIGVGHVGKNNIGFTRFQRPEMRAWLGVDLRPVSPALAAHLDLDLGEVSQVVSVRDDSPAEEAGLREHDIIVSFDGSGPATSARLRELLDEKEPGGDLAIRLLRKGSEQEIDVELGSTRGVNFFGANPFWNTQRLDLGAVTDLSVGTELKFPGIYTVGDNGNVVLGEGSSPLIVNRDGQWRKLQGFLGRDKDGDQEEGGDEDAGSEGKDGNKVYVWPGQGKVYNFPELFEKGQAYSLPEFFQSEDGKGWGYTLGQKKRDDTLMEQIDRLEAMIEKLQKRLDKANKAKKRDN